MEARSDSLLQKFRIIQRAILSEPGSARVRRWVAVKDINILMRNNITKIGAEGKPLRASSAFEIKLGDGRMPGSSTNGGGLTDSETAPIHTCHVPNDFSEMTHDIVTGSASFKTGFEMFEQARDMFFTTSPVPSGTGEGGRSAG
ncbi:hypothetical protein CDAR_507611 [Caerostris darwini]|uniref:Uncharacterized protein n=1 Tax=Caerostris darwini TaxID=1538125 RepID=A0AAV4MW73_9ARAC|nr:hypothetical protein CDAR_507611 [Caerostris darwini]